MAVLGRDELRAQRDGVLVSGSDDDRRDRAVIIGLVAALVLQRRAVGAVDLLGGVVPRAVQRDQQFGDERAPAFQWTSQVKALEGRVIAGEEFFWGNWIEDCPDLT